MFYLKKAVVYTPPENLILSLPDLHEGILLLEYETGLYINDDETLTAITNCIEKEDQAKLELEYYCLNLVDKHCYGGIYRELELFLDFLIHYGNDLFNKVKCIGLYNNGVFPYSYRNRRYNSIQFIRKDVLYQQIRNEIIQDGKYFQT